MVIQRWWYKLRGAQKYRNAINRGDVASEEHQKSRVQKCKVCPRVRGRYAEENKEFVLLGIKGRILTCGVYAQPGDVEGTCGCVVAAECEQEASHIVLDGVPMRAALLTECCNEECESKVWHAVPRADTLERVVSGGAVDGQPISQDGRAA